MLTGLGVAAAAVVAVILVVAMGGSKSGNGPHAAAERLLKADLQQDVKAARDATCEPLHGRIKDAAEPDKSYKIGRVDQNGDTARVAVTVVTSDNESEALTLIERKDGETWKVCDALRGSTAPAPPTGIRTAQPGGPSGPSRFCKTYINATAPPSTVCIGGT